MTAITLVERVEAFLKELGITKAGFCRQVGIDTSTLWRWLHSEIELSSNTLERIDNYLKRYDF